MAISRPSGLRPRRADGPAVVQDPERRRGAQQHRQEVAEGGGDSSRSTPARASSSAWSRRSWLSASAPRRWASRGERGVAGLAALVERDDAGHEREHEQRGEAGEQRAQAAVRVALVLGLVLGLGAALVEEVALELVEVRPRARPPSRAPRRAGRRGRARRGPAAGVPVARRVDQVLVEAAPLGVLLEPAAQARPLAQQRLVRDLERPLVHGHEPAVGEERERGRRLGVVAVELVERHRRRTKLVPCSPASASRSRIRFAATRSGSDSRA